MPALIAILAVFAALGTTLPLAAQAAARTIYRCEREGVITFSDLPCDAAQAAYVPDSSRINADRADVPVPGLGRQLQPA